MLQTSNSFNPTMVRLRLRRAYRSMPGKLLFQSHYGAIATHWGYCLPDRFARVSIPLWCDCDRRWNPPSEQYTILRFQSHYGAIATQFGRETVRGLALFQSHYGAIATEMMLALDISPGGFQSHYGAIATNSLGR